MEMPEIPLLFLKMKVEVSYLVRWGGRHPFAGRHSFAKAEMERQREREREGERKRERERVVTLLSA